MKNAQDNINDWLLREAHVVAGHAFRADDCSCLPVRPETEAGRQDETPLGFLVAHGQDVTYQDAHTPKGEQLLSIWTKIHLLELAEDEQSLPAEYWYG